MKIACSWMFFGAMAIGLLSGPSALRAQPAGDPAETDDEAPPDDEPAPPEAKPAAPEARPAAPEAKPAALDSEQVISPAILALNAPDKPWSRGVSMEDRKAARDLFLEGNRLFRIPLFAKAAEKYVAALGRWKHPVIYLNLAIAELNAGQDVEARESLEHALEHGEEPLGAENFRGAQLQLELVTRQLGRIRVSCRTQGAQVTLDGEPLFIGPGSYEGWVKAKDHEITAKKPDYLSEARRVTVTSGQVQKIDLKLITLREAAEASRRWAAWKPWAVFASGGAIAAIGGTFHTLAAKGFEQYDRSFSGLSCAKETPPQCRDNDSDSGELSKLNDQLKRAKLERSIAMGAYAAGGSLLATGLILLYLNRPRLTERIAEQSSGRGLVVIPTVSADMLGIVVRVYPRSGGSP